MSSPGNPSPSPVPELVLTFHQAATRFDFVAAWAAARALRRFDPDLADDLMRRFYGQPVYGPDEG